MKRKPFEEEYYGSIPEYRCLDCGEVCNITEEAFDYAGTHCTNGAGGTHHTGDYTSDCCDCGFEELTTN